MYKHYIKIRQSDNAILDGFSDAFKNPDEFPGYVVHAENQDRHFRQDWTDQHGHPKYKIENKKIVPRERTQEELDEVEGEKVKQEIISENVELLAMYDFIENGSIRPVLQKKIRAKVQALKVELPN